MKSFKYLSMLMILLFGLTNLAQAKHHATDGELIATLNAINSQEIREANLALEKNVDEKVKEYAKMMKHDHTQSLDKTKELSESINVAPEETSKLAYLKEKGQEKYHELSKLNGHHFEVAYVKSMVKGHEKALSFLNHAIEKAQNTSLKDYLMKVRQTVEMHLEHAKTLQKEEA